MFLNKCKNSTVILFVNIKAKETQANCVKSSKIEECVMSGLEAGRRYRRADRRQQRIDTHETQQK